MSEAPPFLTDPVDQFALLMALAAFVFALGEVKAFARFFNVMPPLVFCYFLPMICTSLGILPAESPVYPMMNRVMLPAVLLLLLISADIPAILKLGWTAIFVMLAGTVGIMGGGVIGYALFRGFLPDGGWMSLGALSASWTGGSGNMFAVRSALDIPQTLFAPVILLDPLIAYSWMGLLLALSGSQQAYARHAKVNPALQEALHAHAEKHAQGPPLPTATSHLIIILGAALSLGALMMAFGATLHGWLAPARAAVPMLKDVLTVSTLGIVLVTTLGIVLSFTRVRELEQVGASRIGYGLLFLLLPAFGAQADLRQIGSAFGFFLVGLSMIAGHAVMIVLAMRLLRAPLFFGAVGSQANVGGPASASLVAAAYAPALAPVGVLLGILGGIIGTYAGLATAFMMKAVAG